MQPGFLFAVGIPTAQSAAIVSDRIRPTACHQFRRYHLFRGRANRTLRPAMEPPGQIVAQYWETGFSIVWKSASGIFSLHGCLLVALFGRHRCPSTVQIRVRRRATAWEAAAPLLCADRRATRRWPLGNDPGSSFRFGCAAAGCRSAGATAIGQKETHRPVRPVADTRFASRVV